ncbi:MAG: putative transporter [Bacilli bacterium]
MEWLNSILSGGSVIQAVIAISLVGALGQILGRIKIMGLSLGVTFVFFVGIFAGHFGLTINSNMLDFAESFGLILFVYALGLQVGPGFIHSLGRSALKMNAIAISVVFLGSLLTLFFKYLFNLPLSDLMGVLSGAVTNTPALAAGQQTLIQMGQDPASMALGCAVAYPLGVVGVIFAIIFLKNILKSSIVLKNKEDNKGKKTVIIELIVENAGVYEKNIQQISSLLTKHFVVSRVWHDGKVTIPLSKTILHKGDRLLIITMANNVESLKILIGSERLENWNKEDIDWDSIDSELVSERILVTKPDVNGKKIKYFRLRNLYGVNVTRVYRSGIVLFPNPDLILLIGDRLTVVGEYASVKNVEKVLGNTVKNLDEPNLVTVFIGMCMGLILGSVPLMIPGISFPVKLGIAGGPILIGIIVGAYGPRIHMITYTTVSANLMLRGIGLSMYLACLGIDAGKQFFETVFCSQGMLWIVLGFAITVIPILIVAIFTIKVMKIDFGTITGILCGSMANPMALSYVNSTIDGDVPSVSYATVYPLSMFLRVIIAQIMIMLFI